MHSDKPYFDRKNFYSWLIGSISDLVPEDYAFTEEGAQKLCEKAAEMLGAMDDLNLIHPDLKDKGRVNPKLN